MPKLGKRLGEFGRIMRLSMTLALLDFKLRNERSYLGVLWYALEPLLLFVVIHGVHSRVELANVPQYATYLFCGLILFSFFRRATTLSIRAISAGGRYVSMMRGSAEPLVLSKVIDAALGHFFELLLLIGVMMVYGIPVWHALLYIPVFVAFAVFVAGLSLLLATIGAFASDAVNAWSVATGLLMFASPVFYVLPSGVGPLRFLNPITAFLEAARAAILDGALPSATAALAVAAWSVAAVAVGATLFRATRHRFAELV
jgi:ABC-type polysaccharide/polyol phosphate export permease